MGKGLLNNVTGGRLSLLLAPVLVLCAVFCTKQDLWAETDDCTGDWMEIPSVRSSEAVHSCYFSLDGKKNRNYTIGWSSKYHLSMWVAYPLCRFHTEGSSGYSARWDYDPNVPRKQQPLLSKSYNGNYDRGHQIPSADRKCCLQANVQTFRFTNATPQLHEFNGGIWESLESRCRHYASKVDTLYVVTGVIMDANAAFTEDRSGMRCPIPAKYYKVVLAKVGKGNSSIRNYGGWAAAAFIFDHKNYGNDAVSKKQSLSVKELERMTGMDFFPKLAKVAGKALSDTIESESPEDNVFWWQQ